VTRLRERAIVLFSNGADGNAFIDEHAADEIERLRVEIMLLEASCYPAVGVRKKLNRLFNKFRQNSQRKKSKYFLCRICGKEHA
jgi:hypothetical protein